MHSSFFMLSRISSATIPAFHDPKHTACRPGISVRNFSKGAGLKSRFKNFCRSLLYRAECVFYGASRSLSFNSDRFAQDCRCDPRLSISHLARAGACLYVYASSCSGTYPLPSDVRLRTGICAVLGIVIIFSTVGIFSPSRRDGFSVVSANLPEYVRCCAAFPVMFPTSTTLKNTLSVLPLFNGDRFQDCMFHCDSLHGLVESGA